MHEPHKIRDQHSEPAQHNRQRPVQTLARAYAEIAAQAAQSNPWVALNEFFHEWWDYSRTERPTLIAEDVLAGGPSMLLDTSPSELPASERDRRWRWAVFCAAVADYLCEREGLVPPAWVVDPRYTLTEPWYASDATGNMGVVPPLAPAARAHLEQTTPASLRHRNILCGDRVFANKYDFAQQVQRLNASRRNAAGRDDAANEARSETSGSRSGT